MGAAASVKGMDREALAAEAERYRVPAAVCATIREHDIDGATALELAQLPDAELATQAQEMAQIRAGLLPNGGRAGGDSPPRAITDASWMVAGRTACSDVTSDGDYYRSSLGDGGNNAEFVSCAQKRPDSPTLGSMGPEVAIAIREKPSRGPCGC